ncbi:MAG: hypothetical protein EOO85_22070 [Pedobacter sp.]|nr:MAG: hypothetical protein EOO85_22070 [Pedobacter sp.]
MPLTIFYILNAWDDKYSDVYTNKSRHTLSSVTLEARREQSNKLIRICKGTVVNRAFMDQAKAEKSISMRINTFIIDGKVL